MRIFPLAFLLAASLVLAGCTADDDADESRNDGAGTVDPGASEVSGHVQVTGNQTGSGNQTASGNATSSG